MATGFSTGFTPQDFAGFGAPSPMALQQRMLALGGGTPAAISQLMNSTGAGTIPSTVNIPEIAIPDIGSMGGNSGTPFLQKANLALTGLNTLGNLWSAFQAQKLAKRQFNYARDVSETNLANQIQSYNTALADRARSRAAMEGQSPEQAQAYIDQNRLVR